MEKCDVEDAAVTRRPERRIHPTGSLLEAMAQMDQERVKLLLVVDHDDKFLAPLSMGDIQRYYLEHNHFNASAADVIADRESLVARVGEGRAEIERRMRQHRLEAMPVLGDAEKLDSVIEWSDIGKVPKQPSVAAPVVVMAGGKGTRMQPLTHVIPKPLIPLGERTILERILWGYADAGAREFWISINYKGDMIRHHLAETAPSDWQLGYLEETQYQGTAGSLHLLKGKVKETFVVCNCDILIEESLSAVMKHHVAKGNELTVIAAVHEQAVPYGVLECSTGGALTGFTEKPVFTYLVNTGAYILEPELLDEIPTTGEFHMTELIAKIHARGGRVGIYPISDGSWLDVGTWDEYRKACSHHNARGVQP